MIESLLIGELKRDEGVFYSPYKDPRGIDTVGIGHNLIAKPLPNQTYPMTVEQVEALCESDLQVVFDDLDKNLSWWRDLSEVRQRVIANMCFNLGIGSLLAFKTTLAHIKAGEYSLAATSMLNSLWAKQVKARAQRLAHAMEFDVMIAA